MWLFLQAWFDVLLTKANDIDVAVFKRFLLFPPPEGKSKQALCFESHSSLKTEAASSTPPKGCSDQAVCILFPKYTSELWNETKALFS